MNITKEKQLQKQVYAWFCLQFPKHRRAFVGGMEGVLFTPKNVPPAALGKELKELGIMQKAKPDILILIPNRHYTGLAMELKANESDYLLKSGELKQNKHIIEQTEYLNYLTYLGFYSSFQHDFHTITRTITEYIKDNDFQF